MKVIIFIVLTGIVLSLPGNESRPSRQNSLNSVAGFVPHGSTDSRKFRVETPSVESNSSKIESKSTGSDNSVSCRKKRDIRIQGAQEESAGRDNGQRNRKLNELNRNTDEKRTKRSLLNPGVTPKSADPTKIETTTTPSPASYFAVAWIHSFMMK